MLMAVDVGDDHIEIAKPLVIKSSLDMFGDFFEECAAGLKLEISFVQVPWLPKCVL